MRRAVAGDTEIVLVEAWQREGFDVFVTRRHPAGREVYRPAGYEADGVAFAAHSWQPLGGAEAAPAPSFFLSEEALEALVAAGGGLKPASSAMAEHLADVVKVRDRLLDVAEAAASNAPAFYDTLELIKAAKR